MARFKVDFLGCKVSHVDAHEVREALLRDGHAEGDGADVAVISTCCVTNEAVAKSRKAAARAARSYARVYVTGQNVWIATAYSGFDPEVNSMGGDPRTRGVDDGVKPLRVTPRHVQADPAEALGRCW